MPVPCQEDTMTAKKEPSFWSTTAGVVTVVTGLLTAVAGLLTVAVQTGWNRLRGRRAPKDGFRVNQQLPVRASEPRVDPHYQWSHVHL